MTMREYGSRTAATNFLRGKGVAAADFNKFLRQRGAAYIVNDALIGAPAEPATEAEKVKLPLATNITVIGKDLKPHELHVEVTEVAEKAPKRAAAKPAKAHAKTGKPTKDAKPTAAKPAAKKGGKPPISQRCLALFLEGKDNAAVWEVIKKEYGMDDDRSHYPAWYRSHFRRRGELPAASAKKGKK